MREGLTRGESITRELRSKKKGRATEKNLFRPRGGGVGLVENWKDKEEKEEL